LGVVFLLYLVVNLLLGARALSFPMVYDDLDLLRPYSADEVLGSFHGNWDPDGLQTPGFRPLSLLFNWARYEALGEHVVAHRVFLIVLFALFLTLLVPLAERLGTPRFGAVLGGLLVLCSRYSVFHYVWITDGNHMLQGFAFEAALALLLTAIETGGMRPLIGSSGALLLGLLVREDTAAVVPVFLLLGGAFALRRGKGLRTLAVYAVLVGGIALGLILYRRFVVPEAWIPTPHVRKFAGNVVRSLEFPGDEVADLETGIAVYAWRGAALLLVSGLVLSRRWLPFLWLGATVVSATASLAYSRADLLFFPVAFAGLFFGSAGEAIATARPPLRHLARGAVLVGALGGAYASLLFALNFHPMSSTAMVWNWGYLRGPAADRARIPWVRRRVIAAQLHSLGLRTARDMKVLFPELVAEAVDQGRREPGPDGVLFVPRLQNVW
jgi:hypothetical protein